MTGLEVGAAVSTIGSFVFSAVGLGRLLKENIKDRTTIIKEARQELSSALAILDACQADIHHDVMAPLMGRYYILRGDVRDLEEDIASPRGFLKAIKSLKLDMREAKQTHIKTQLLYRDSLAASDSRKYAKLVRVNGLAPGGKLMPSTPHPIPVAGSSGEFEPHTL